MLLVTENAMADIKPHTDTIIHIGAGQASELQTYLETEAQRIILVEPNPTLAVKLRSKIQQFPHVEVLERAITDNPTRNTLYEYNLPEASGLYLADGLKMLFPGLRQTNQYAVATQTPQSLVQDCQLQAENNTLVIQAPGAELAIVSALIESGAISHFNLLEITCSEHSLHDADGDGNAEGLKQALQNEGFELKAKDSHNPDWPVWNYASSPVARKLKSVMHKNQTMTQTLALQEQELAKRGASLAQVYAELEQARANHQNERTELENTNSQLSAQLTAAQQEAEQAQHEAKQAQEQARQAQEEARRTQEHQRSLQAQLRAARDAADHLEMQKATLQNQCSQNAKSLEEASTRYAEDLRLWEEKNRELSGQLENEKQQRERCEQENLKLQQELTTTKENAQQSINASTAQAEQTKQALERLQREHDNQLKSLQEQLIAERAGKEQFNELKNKMEYLFGQHTLQLEQAANALGRHVTSTVTSTAKDLEAGIALQQQYGQDLPSLEDQNGRLPPSVALQLSRQLKTQPYDVIIELGSGVTTTFMAHTLRNHTGKSDEPHSGEKQVAHYVDASEDDLPKRIICFEHNRTTYNKLLENLKTSGLAPLINVHYAPLVATSYQGQERLFYDCANTLQRVATLFEGRQARIFILVNVPQGASQPDTAAALPQVLQHLAAHTLDVVVNKQGEKDLTKQWHKLLDQRGLQYEQATEFGSNKFQRLTVNP